MLLLTPTTLTIPATLRVIAGVSSAAVMIAMSKGEGAGIMTGMTTQEGAVLFEAGKSDQPLQDQKVLHLLNRISFGPTLAAVEKVNWLGLFPYLEDQLHPERIPDPSIEEKLAGLKSLKRDSRELLELYPPLKLAREQGSQMQGPRRNSSLLNSFTSRLRNPLSLSRSGYAPSWRTSRSFPATRLHLLP